MPQRSFRLSDDLDARLGAQAAAEDRSVAFIIVRALTKELAQAEGTPTKRARAASPTQTHRAPLSDRQAALNKSKGLG